MFRKRQAATQTEDDAIPEDLLAAIPDLENQGNSGEPAGDNPFTAFNAGKDAAPWTAPKEDKQPEPYSWSIPTSEGKGAKKDKEAGKDLPKSEAKQMPKIDETEVRAMVAEVRKQMEQAMMRELSKVEETFANTFQDMSSRLNKSQNEITHLKEANESLLRAKVDYERKIESLKAIVKNIGDL